MTEPALAGSTDPVEVVQRCQRRGDQEGSNVLLAALLRQADADPIAVRTVLMAVLPGLAALSARYRWLVGGDLGAWSGVDQLDQEIVTSALERITAMAGATHRWPASTIIGSVRENLRQTERRERRRRSALVPLAAAATREAVTEPSAAEALASVVVDAARRGSLSTDRAAVVYATRILGHSPEELARACGRDVRAVRAQRARAERVLITSGY